MMATNCPNCGAPITKSKCEYCGTTFDDTLEARRNILLAEMDMCRQREMRAYILSQLNMFRPV